ncbi:hypothetical protein CG723_04285 [Streptomyces sp. CB01635]|nr:hypothetical protein CG723_04285 [Streptomyces sp. CB01635]
MQLNEAGTADGDGDLVVRQDDLGAAVGDHMDAGHDLAPVTRKPAPIRRPHSILACRRALFTRRPWPCGPSPTR